MKVFEGISNITASELNSFVIHAIASSSLCSAYPRVCRSEGPDGFIPPCTYVVYVCVHVCVYVYIYVSVYVYVCVHMHVCTCIIIYTCVSVSVHVYVCRCMLVCIKVRKESEKDIVIKRNRSRRKACDANVDAGSEICHTVSNCDRLLIQRR